MDYKKIECEEYNIHIIKNKNFHTIDFRIYFTSNVSLENITYFNFLVTILTYATSKYDSKENDCRGKEKLISTRDSKIKVFIIPTDEEVMTEIVKDDSDFVNNKPAMEAAATDDSYAFAVLGDQNPLAMFCEGAEKIDLSNLSEYDQGCNESFQNAAKNYFEGNATLDEALDMFKKAVVEKYPELTAE